MHEIVTLAVTGKEAQGTEAEASSFGAKQATPLLKFVTVWPRAKGALREDEKIKDVSQFRTERDDEMRGPHLRHVRFGTPEGRQTLNLSRGGILKEYLYSGSDAGEDDTAGKSHQIILISQESVGGGG